MRRPGERGILLLPVALVLAITGALAYGMTREGSMDVAAVDAEYDIEVARYLAEAGLNLAKWQNEKRGCGSEVGFGTVDLPGGRIVAGDNDVDDLPQGAISVSLVATTARGAVHRLEGRRVMLHAQNVAEVTLDNAQDLSIIQGSTAPAGEAWLELTDDRSHALLKFNLPPGLRDVAVLKADLKLLQIDTKSSQPQRSLAVHRVTRDWPPGATWISPWATPGGDYAASATASVAIGGNARYTWRIDALVEGWVNGRLPNHGILLKPSGLLEARFASIDNSSGNTRPQLVVRYFPRC